MCLDIKWYSFKRKARKDIECFKYLEKSIVSEHYITPHQKFPVRIGDTYVSKLKRVYNNWRNHPHFIEDGIHSIATFDGLMKAIPMYSWTVKVRCVIPKGSYYYKGTWEGGMNRVNSYASTALKIVEIV